VPPEPPVPAIGSALRRAASSSLGSQSPDDGPSAAASPTLAGRLPDPHQASSAPSASAAPSTQLPPPALSTTPLTLSPQGTAVAESSFGAGHPQGFRDAPAAGGATDDMVVSAPRRSAGPSAAATANGTAASAAGGGGSSGNWGGALLGARWSPGTGELYNPFGDNPLQRAFAGNYKCDRLSTGQPLICCSAHKHGSNLSEVVSACLCEGPVLPRSCLHGPQACILTPKTLLTLNGNPNQPQP